MTSMNKYYKISGRYFIKTSVVSRVALPAYNTISVQAMNQLQDRKNDGKFTNDVLLHSVCDIHMYVRRNPAWLTGPD